MAKNKRQFRKLSEVRDRTLRKEAAKEPDLTKQTNGFTAFINISYAFVQPKGFKAHLTFLRQLPQAYRDYKSLHAPGRF
jgi:hypothetical protein